MESLTLHYIGKKKKGKIKITFILCKNCKWMKKKLDFLDILKYRSHQNKNEIFI